MVADFYRLLTRLLEHHLNDAKRYGQQRSEHVVVISKGRSIWLRLSKRVTNSQVLSYENTMLSSNDEDLWRGNSDAGFSLACAAMRLLCITRTDEYAADMILRA